MQALNWLDVLTHGAVHGGVALMAWLALGATAMVDTFKGIVPDKILLAGTIPILAIMFYCAPLELVGKRLAVAVLFGGLIWGANELWYRRRGQDALGMGDVKWSMLAILAFGVWPVILAWSLGAWFGLGVLAGFKIMKRPVPHIHFAPCLFLGLIVGQWLATRFYL